MPDIAVIDMRLALKPQTALMSVQLPNHSLNLKLAAVVYHFALH